ncbi:MAG: di-heme oxidoredictase family protein [Litorilituus sp.]|nr:di-heme oxidoredictase family protein [Litorilituus sp.]
MSDIQVQAETEITTDIQSKYTLLRLGLVILAICLLFLGRQIYTTVFLPFTGYGDADMSYLDKELPASLSAGDLTHFHSKEKAFEQEAPNLSWGLSAAFDRGDGIFERPYAPAQRPGFSYNADGLGPIFNQASCESCHLGDGRAKPPAGPNEILNGGFIRVSVPGVGPYGEPMSPKGYGHQIGDRAIEGVQPEAKARINWVEHTGKLPDGTVYSLRRPEFLLTELAYGEMPKDTVYELRMAPPVHGLGLLEAIPEETILSWADPEDSDGDGISGRPNYVWDLERGGKILGRFSWKANAFDIRQQSAAAAYNDMGVNNPLFLYRHDDQSKRHKSRQNCEPEQTACLAATDSLDFELTPGQLSDVTTYLQLLGVVYRRNMDDPLVQKGEQLFHQIGCENCHKSQVMTGEHEISRLENQLIRPYSDLLLHDMGEGLSGRRDFEATQQEWRTAPLWGIGVTKTVNGHTNYLHDGRARNVEEAILWHGGEGEQAKQNYMHLTQSDRQLLINFINNL